MVHWIDARPTVTEQLWPLAYTTEHQNNTEG